MLNIRKEYNVFMSSSDIHGLKKHICKQYPSMSVVDVHGKYKGVKEDSIAVTCSSLYYVGVLLSLAEDDGQESILVVTPTNTPVFMYTNGDIVSKACILLDDYTEGTEKVYIDSGLDYCIIGNINKIMRVI